MAGTLVRRMEKADKENLYFKVAYVGQTSVLEECTPFTMLTAGLIDLPRPAGKRVADETIEIGKLKIDCDVFESTAAGIDGKYWVPKKEKFAEPILKLDLVSSGMKWKLTTQALDQKKTVGRVSVRCQVVELVRIDDRDAKVTRTVWLSRDVPGWLLKIEEQDAGSLNTAELIEIGAGK